MGERTTGLSQPPTPFEERVMTTNGAGRDGHSPRETVRLLDGQITMLRDELGELVAELDRRRHAALDVKGHLRRHGGEIALTSVALMGAAAGFVWFGVWRHRRRQRLGARVGRMQHAVSRMIDRPDRVAAEPTVTMKVLTAVANAVVATVIKKVLGAGVHKVMERQRLAAADRPGLASPAARPKIFHCRLIAASAAAWPPPGRACRRKCARSGAPPSGVFSERSSAGDVWEPFWRVARLSGAVHRGVNRNKTPTPSPIGEDRP